MKTTAHVLTPTLGHHSPILSKSKWRKLFLRRIRSKREVQIDKEDQRTCSEEKSCE